MHGAECVAWSAACAKEVWRPDDGRSRAERRLAAILAADVVRYSRLMGRDETGTLVRLRLAAAS